MMVAYGPSHEEYMEDIMQEQGGLCGDQSLPPMVSRRLSHVRG